MGYFSEIKTDFNKMFLKLGVGVTHEYLSLNFHYTIDNSGNSIVGIGGILRIWTAEVGFNKQNTLRD